MSGGQTGVDRAALDAARDLAKASGGWCPRGRRAEDGPIAAHYPLVETPSADYRQRTRLNVQDSDGTLIIAEGALSGGTRLTASIAAELGRPLLTIDATKPDLDAVDAWLSACAIQTKTTPAIAPNATLVVTMDTASTLILPTATFSVMPIVNNVPTTGGAPRAVR